MLRISGRLREVPAYDCSWVEPAEVSSGSFREQIWHIYLLEENYCTHFPGYNKSSARLSLEVPHKFWVA